MKETEDRLNHNPNARVFSALNNNLLSCHICFKLSELTSRRCSRCSAVLHPRKPGSLQRTLALLITACLLYIPANLYPIMVTRQFGVPEPSTIVGGILILLDMGAYPVASVIFVASVIVPLAKILALFYICLSVGKADQLNLKQKTRLFRVAEYMGKWSMVDVFVVSILVALVQIQGLMVVTPGFAAICFSGVVIVTMIAAEAFDPRLIWSGQSSVIKTKRTSA